MKKHLIFLEVLFLTIKISAQPAWTNQYSLEHVNTISFVNDMSGWVCGKNGILLRTQNGGSNWTVLSSGQTGLHYGYIQFISSDIGYLTGYLESIPQSIFLRKSTNGGTSWNTVQSNLQFKDIYYCSEQIGYLINYNDSLFKTSNGGNNWFPHQNNEVSSCKSFYFINSTTGWIVGGKIFKTTNAGISWNMQHDFNNVNSISRAFFLNEQTGWGASSNVLLKTTNSGIHWDTASTINTLFTTTLYFINNLTGWYQKSNGGFAQKTTNGGSNWVNENFLMLDMYFKNSTTGWACTTTGLMNTTNGGVSITKIDNIIPKEFSLSQNYPNPFNPSTNIKFSIPKSSLVKIKILDISGKEIYEILNSHLKTGNYQTNFNGSNLSSGIYFYKIEAGNFADTKKMILIK